MKLIYEPTVYLASKQTLPFQNGVREFLRNHGTEWRPECEDPVNPVADSIPEIAGRLCYMSFDKPRPGGNKAYLDHIKQVGHGSVLEHTVFGFIFTGVSRSLTHELVRHRSGFSYSQLSQRYVDESEAEYVVPPELREQVELAWGFMEGQESGQWGADKLDRWDDVNCHWCFERNTPLHQGIKWLRSVAVAHESYVDQVGFLSARLESKILDKTARRKAARGAARSLLPNATETKVFVTANARAWRHFIEMRGAAPAEAEIRHLAYKTWLVLKDEAPNLFSDYEWKLDDKGLPLDVFTPNRKV